MSLIHLVELALLCLLSAGGGFYLGKRYGTTLAADTKRLESTVATIKKDV